VHTASSVCVQTLQRLVVVAVTGDVVTGAVGVAAAEAVVSSSRAMQLSATVAMAVCLASELLLSLLSAVPRLAELPCMVVCLDNGLLLSLLSVLLRDGQAELPCVVVCLAGGLLPSLAQFLPDALPRAVDLGVVVVTVVVVTAGVVELV